MVLFFSHLDERQSVSQGSWYFYLLVSHQTLSFSVSEVHTGLYSVCLCVGDRHRITATEKSKTSLSMSVLLNCLVSET